MSPSPNVSLCPILWILFIGTLQSAALQFEEFEYIIVENSVTITDFPEDLRVDVTIPPAIDELPVTAIGDRAFGAAEKSHSLDFDQPPGTKKIVFLKLDTSGLFNDQGMAFFISLDWC